MKITDAFLGEHGVFYAQFDHLDRVLEGEPTLETVQALAGLLAAALAPHAALENELLFDPAAQRPGGEGGPMAAMHEEHDEIEGLLADVGKATDAGPARDGLREVLTLAREHFHREEEIAFRVAESLLGTEEVEGRTREWGVRRGVRTPGRAPARGGS